MPILKILPKLSSEGSAIYNGFLTPLHKTKKKIVRNDTAYNFQQSIRKHERVVSSSAIRFEN